MQKLSDLISDDGRTLLGRCKRRELEKIATHLKLTFKHGQPAEDLRKLIEGSGATMNDVRQAVEVEVVYQKDENGNTFQTEYPKKKPHATASKDINYEDEIERRAAAHANEIRTKDEQIERLAKMVDDLSQKVAALTKKPHLEEHWPDNPQLLHINTLKRKMREIGLDVKAKHSKRECLDMLEKHRSENVHATAGSEQGSSPGEHPDGGHGGTDVPDGRAEAGLHRHGSAGLERSVERAVQRLEPSDAE